MSQPTFAQPAQPGIQQATALKFAGGQFSGRSNRIHSQDAATKSLARLKELEIDTRLLQAKCRIEAG